MKFTSEYNKIFKYTKNYVNDIYHTVEKFKIFCEDIANDNAYTAEEKDYKNIHTYLNDIVNILTKIKDKYLNLKQCYDDIARPSVLYPHEKQAIWQYMKKPNMQASCSRPFGCLYAEKILIDNKPKVVIGMSVCNDNDTFYKNIALNLARTRAREYPKTYDIRVNSPSSLFQKLVRVPSKNMYESEIAKFIKRCARWFEAEEIIYPNNIIFTEFSSKKNKKKKSDKITDKLMPF